MLNIPWRFKVRKGCHRSVLFWRPFFSKKVKFKFRFDESHRGLDDETNQINKLFGFSEALDHHKASARFGYMNMGEYVKIYAYTYDEEGRYTQDFCTVKVGVKYEAFIECKNDKYVLKVQDMPKLTVPRKPGSNYRYKHLLYPYVGGEIPARKTVKFKIWI